MTLYVGLMSGTSVDAVDAALVHIGADSTRVLATHCEPIEDELRAELLTLATRDYGPYEQLWSLDARLGELFARAALSLLDAAGVDPTTVAAIGSHGQTVRHRPEARPPFTVQLGDPNVIAQRTGLLGGFKLRGKQ